MTSSVEFPALRHLLEGYLNLDWPEEYGEPWKAVADFASGEPELSAVLGEEIWQVLMGRSAESELESLVVGDLGSGYHPAADGWTFQSWLIELARRVRRINEELHPDGDL